MGDEDRSRELPQRARGAARPGPGPSAPSSAPLLSEEVRQRMRAAVEAERAEAARREKEQVTEPSQHMTTSRTADSDVASPSTNGIPGQRKRAVKAEPHVKAQPARNLSVDPKPAVAVPSRTERSPHAKPSARKGRSHRRLVNARLVVLVLLLIVASSLATAVLIHRVGSPGDSDSASGALQRQEVVARNQAAVWVSQQVSPDASVSCDRAMCAALVALKFPRRNLLTLESTSTPPVTSAVVVVTAAVRDMFGSSLAAAYAPAVLASFGSGAAEVDVRVMAPHGTASFWAAFNAGLAARQSSGSVLVGNPRITVSATANKQLTAGQVDSRLVLSLADLASDQPIDIVRFENVGPGVGPGVLLRAADLAVDDQTPGVASSTYTQELRTSLAELTTQSRPSSQIVAAQGVPTVFRVDFTAPSPLGGVQ